MIMDRLAVAFTLGIILFSLGLIFWVSSWEIPRENNPTDSGQPEWVLLQPQKCWEIPWRKEWSIENQQPYSSFPVQDEVNYLQKYYTERGITILEAQFTYQPISDTCTGCGCPEPFVFALYVNQTDAARLSISGFTILDNSNPYIFTGPLFRQSVNKPISSVSADECAGLFSTSTILDEIFGSKKDSCYVQAAISARDVTLCQNVSAAQAKQTCISEVAVATKDVSLCTTLSSASAKTSCITGVAGLLQKPALCANIVDSSARTWCQLGATPK
jgi:hypothetical protein